MSQVRMVEKFTLRRRKKGRRWEGKITEVFQDPDEFHEQARPGKVSLNFSQDLELDTAAYPDGTVVIVSVPKGAKGWK